VFGIFIRSKESSETPICLLCKHCAYGNGSDGYSEYTPGWQMDVRCVEGFWILDPYRTTQAEFASYLRLAETCPKYELDPLVASERKRLEGGA